MKCDKCGNIILDYYEHYHLVVEESKLPEDAKIWCEDCFEENQK